MTILCTVGVIRGRYGNSLHFPPQLSHFDVFDEKGEEDDGDEWNDDSDHDDDTSVQALCGAVDASRSCW